MAETVKTLNLTEYEVEIVKAALEDYETAAQDYGYLDLMQAAGKLLDDLEN